jgi:hypothetical protein
VGSRCETGTAVGSGLVTSEDAWRESTSSWENWTGVPL